MNKINLLKILLSLSIIFLIGCTEVQEEIIELDERCNWEPGRCLSQGKGWRYSSVTSNCIYFDNKACTNAPFKTKTECEEVCKN